MRKTMWAAKNPNVILSVDRDIGPKSHPPLCRDLREAEIFLELGQPALSDVKGLRRRRLSEDGPG